MIRIAFLGSDSSHTEAFGNLINRPGGAFHAQARVVSIWGEDASEAARKADALGISTCAATVCEALKDVDLAMVIGRFGDSHYEPARIAIEQGLPTFVDKPFTASFEQAERLIRLASLGNGHMISSSPLRFARELEDLSREKLRPEFVSVAAPANCIDLGDDRRLQSAFFYGIHAVEMLLELMGHEVRRVEIVPGKRAVTIQVEFREGAGSVQLLRDVDEFYEVQVVYRHHLRQHFTVSLDGSYYPRLLNFLFDQFYSGSRTISLESTLQAIDLLEKTEEAVLGVKDDT